MFPQLLLNRGLTVLKCNLNFYTNNFQWFLLHMPLIEFNMTWTQNIPSKFLNGVRQHYLCEFNEVN